MKKKLNLMSFALTLGALLAGEKAGGRAASFAAAAAAAYLATVGEAVRERFPACAAQLALTGWMAASGLFAVAFASQAGKLASAVCFGAAVLGVAAGLVEGRVRAAQAA